MFRFVFLICIASNISAQGQIFKKQEEEKRGIRLPKYVATKNTYGMIAGIERGQYTFMELGAEKHWKKIRLVHARTIGANGNLEYNFGNNVLGYNAGAWVKTGRVDLTYGFNLNYITDFEKSRYGLGPQIGFRLLGLHFVNGYNFLLGNKELTQVNKFYVGLRYYFPLQSKTTIVNINKRTPSEKERAREKTKSSDTKAKSDDKNKKDNKSSSVNKKTKKNAQTKKGRKNEPVIEEKKHHFDIFRKKQPASEPENKNRNGKKDKRNKNNNDSKVKKEPEKKKKLWDYFKNNE